MFISNSSMEKLTAIYRTVVLYHKIELDTVLKLRQFIYSVNLKYLERYLTLSFYEHIILLNEYVLNLLKKNIKDDPIFKEIGDDSNSSEWDHLSEADTKIIWDVITNCNWKEIDEKSIILFDYNKDLNLDSDQIEYINETVDNKLFFLTYLNRDGYNKEITRELRDYKIGLLI